MSDEVEKIPRDGAPIKVLAVIPTLGKDVERLNRAIRSVRDHSGKHSPYLVVVDNSGDGLLKGLESVDEILRYGMNLGWVGSIEAVRRRYRFEYLWTVQDDMTMINDVLGILLSSLEAEPSLGVSSPVSLENGMVPPFSRGGVLDDAENLKWSNIPKMSTPPDQITNPSNLCFVSGSGALWRGSALESAGGFGVNLYPLVHVDVDMCFRLTRFEWRLKISNQAHVQHDLRGSTSSLLGSTLSSINEELVRKNYVNYDPTSEKGQLALDRDILFGIASKASYLLLELGREGSKRIEASEAQVELRRTRSVIQMLLSTKAFKSLYNSYVRLLNSPNRTVSKATRSFGNSVKKAFKLP
jgi:GT2 family glycosyltransferase